MKKGVSPPAGGASCAEGAPARGAGSRGSFRCVAGLVPIWIQNGTRLHKLRIREKRPPFGGRLALDFPHSRMSDITPGGSVYVCGSEVLNTYLCRRNHTTPKTVKSQRFLRKNCVFSRKKAKFTRRTAAVQINFFSSVLTLYPTRCRLPLEIIVRAASRRIFGNYKLR